LTPLLTNLDQIGGNLHEIKILELSRYLF